MAEKHKSKYKKPENTKYKSRKDLKDYTLDDKDGKMNPKSAGEKQSNVLRKTDKPMVDDGKMDVKWNADDRLYKDLEDGEYDAKHAAKVLKKRQDTDEKDNEKNIKDKIENLTREQKERLVREYLRRKIEKVISEQFLNEQPAEEEPVDPAAAPVDPTAPAPTPEAPAPTDAAPVDPAAAPAPIDPAAPAPTPATGEEELSDESKQAISIEKFVKQLQDDGGNIARIKTLAKVFNLAMKEVDVEDKVNFYKLLKQLAAKKLTTVEAPQETK
jgi:cell division septation protein DedD